MNMQPVKKQSGFVLPVGMILLFILSIIGIGAMKDARLQERMSNNYVDSEKSFQSAESALRIVQRNLLWRSVEEISATPGFHSTTADPTGAPVFANIDIANTGFTVNALSTTTENRLNASPVVMIEEIGSVPSLKDGKKPENKELAKRFFRVTALGYGESAEATTILQGVVER